MGGGGSRPAAAPAPTTVSACPGGVKQVDREPEPKPVNKIDGLSRAVVDANNLHCLDCKLKVPANASASSVMLTRRTGDKFSELSKVFIKPSLPFTLNYRGTDHTVDTMTLYYPSPIRIENVQHDAILSLGDPSVDSTLVILIPLVASNEANAGTAFLDRITPFIRSTLGAQGVLDTQNVDLTRGSQPVLTDRCTGVSSEAGVTEVKAKLKEAENDATQIRNGINQITGPGTFDKEVKPRISSWVNQIAAWRAQPNATQYDLVWTSKLQYYADVLKLKWPENAYDILFKEAGRPDGDTWSQTPYADGWRERLRIADVKVQSLKDALKKAEAAAKEETEKQMNSYIQAEIAKTQLTSCNDTSVSTGADWNLTKLMPVDAQSMAHGPYYTWSVGSYVEKVVSDTACKKVMRWEKTDAARQYIVFANPVMISSSALISIRTLPYTDPTKAIDPIDTYVYKDGPCLNCRPALRGDAEYLKQMQARDAAIQPGKEDLMKIALGFFGAILVAIAVYMAVKWTFKPVVQEMPPLGDKTGVVAKNVVDTTWAAIKGFFKFIRDLIVGAASDSSQLPGGLGALTSGKGVAELTQSLGDGGKGVAGLVKSISKASDAAASGAEGVGALAKNLSKVGNIKGLAAAN
jgi:hypothetical protein